MPSILHEPQAVDTDNLAATVIKDGYHKLEDVYRDVPRDQWPKVETSSLGLRVVSLIMALGLAALRF